MITPHAIIVCGVSGAGKSSFASALAAALEMPFLEGDAYHPGSNIQKMAAGIALRDEDRWPWLDALSAAIVAASGGRGVVATCSALKRSYRDHLRRAITGPAVFICLIADRETLMQRIQAREKHFMPAALLESQLLTFEPPTPDEQAIVPTSPVSVEQLLPSLLGRLRQPGSASAQNGNANGP